MVHPTDSPWLRLKNPMQLWDDIAAKQLLDLTDADFAMLLRSNLLPPEPTGPKRELWNRYWRILQDDDRLTSRAEKVLSGYLSAVEQALNTEDLPEPEHRRAVKFQVHVENAWERFAPTNLPAVRKRFGPNARTVLGLVEAIVDHHEQLSDAAELRPEDEELWTVLARLNLQDVARLV